MNNHADALVENALITFWKSRDEHARDWDSEHGDVVEDPSPYKQAVDQPRTPKKQE